MNEPFDHASVDNDHTEVPQQAVQERRGTDPARPEAVRGRYILPNPVGGKSKSWQRVTTFVALSADTYHLERWQERNVALGVAGFNANQLFHLAQMDVKADKAKLDAIVQRAKEEAGAFKAADRGTELHKSSEDADFAGSWQDPYSILQVTPDDRPQIQLYLDTLRMHGLEVAYLGDGTPCIERVTASQKYEVAGKLDRVYREVDGSYVVGDLKTKGTLDFGVGEIAAQLACYEDGINNTGIWDGRQYNRSLRVRTDYGLVVHLPQNGDTCTVHRVDLSTGREIARVCLDVRDSRRIKGADTISAYQAPALSQDERDAYWLEQANAAHNVDELRSVWDRVASFDQRNTRLADQFRLIAKGL